MAINASEANYRRLRPGQLFHMPPPAQPVNTTVRLTLEGSSEQPEIELTDMRRQYSWHVTMQQAAENSTTWTANVQLPMAPTIMSYVFHVNGIKLLERRLVESRDTTVGNRPVYGEWAQSPFKIAVYDPQRMPADWTHGMVVYQIFPDRFARTQSEDEARARMKGVYGHEPMLMPWDGLPEDPPLGRDFFGGDLRGVIDRLDYLAELGVECLYFNPLFEASSNHRYEAIDFLKIDQMLGTNDDFDELIAQAHARGIRVVLDGVFNHCSSDSIYFDITGKFGNGATQSKESPYYRWFRFEQWPDQYDGWLGLGFMPEFVECPEMEHYFLGEGGVVEHWLNRGIDGWRLDVTFDNTDEFWRRFRQRVDQIRPDAWTIAEEWRDATRYLLGDQFSATMNYRLAWAVRGFFAMDYLSTAEFEDRIQAWMRDTPAPALHAQMNLLDSHDIDRMMTACRGNRERFLQAYAYLFAAPGAPTIFYGTETGIEGRFPEDSRRPMPWDALDSDLVAYFKHLMNTRKTHPVLRHGQTETVLIDDDKRLYGLRRTLNNDSVYALFNVSSQPQRARLPMSDTDGSQWIDLLGHIDPVSVADGHITLTLAPRGAVWLARRA